MVIKLLVVIICVVAKFRGSVANGRSFQDCFQADSISCLQLQLFKMTRSVMDNDTIDIFSGLGLIKLEGYEGKSLEQKANEERVQEAKDIENRQTALETYLLTAVEKFWKERTVTWNPAQTARALVSTMPDTVTNQLTNFVLQARGKKKVLQMILPLLVALKMKIATIGAIAFMIIALIAKKALLAGVVSLVITGMTGLKSLFYTYKAPIHATEVVGYQAASDWEPSTFGNSFSSYEDKDTAQKAG